jgi:hypothetical protein
MLIGYTITGRRKWLIVAPNMIVLAVIGTAFVAILSASRSAWASSC